LSRLPTGRGGSSTMPHKQIPSLLRRFLRPPLASRHGEHRARGWPENTSSLGAQSEWEVVPEIVRHTASGSHQLANLLPRLVIHSDKMRANLELTNGLIYAEAVSLALSEKLDRASAHKLVEAACRLGQAEKRHLRDILCADPEVTAILSPGLTRQSFSPKISWLADSSLMQCWPLHYPASQPAASG
jgi:3-carboxy-cis,cis-muconate cycloisomerase